MKSEIISANTKIEIGQQYQINDFIITVESCLFSIINGITYYQVKIIDEELKERFALLRIGSINGGLKRELDLREKLGQHRMISELFTHQTIVDTQGIETPDPSTIDTLQVETPDSSSVENQDLPDIQNNPDDDMSEEQSNLEDNNTEVKIQSDAKIKSQGDRIFAETSLVNKDDQAKNNEDDEDDENDENNDDDIDRTDEQMSQLKQEDNLDEAEIETEIEIETEENEQNDNDTNGDSQDSNSEFLDEVYEEELPLIPSQDKLIVLSEFLPSEESLSIWLEKKNSFTESLLLISQVTQFFRQAIQQKYCFVSLIPQFIQKSHNNLPVKFFDLTHVYLLNEELSQGIAGDYYPPEIMLGGKITETMSTYVAGSLLYEALYNQLPLRNDRELIDVDQIVQQNLPQTPRIHQLLKIALAQSPEERFLLSQFLSLTISTRKYFEKKKVRWQVSNQSSIGLSLKRLENEDNYGVLQSSASNENSFVLAIVADGMGGMAKGEVASKTAVETMLNSPISTSISTELDTDQKRSDWLVSLVSEANREVCKKVRNGGTTLSAVLAIDRKLYLAHVGDSRIFLIRNGTICQLSEDHSYVAMLLATESITYEESQNHPDKNMLTKSLGSNPTLPYNYVQTLNRFSDNLSLTLEDEDILLLCSDGVWDLVNAEQLLDNFTKKDQELHVAVTESIQQVIEKGAHDNATLVALKCHLEDNLF